MKYLLEFLDDVKKSMSNKRKVLLLDYDGTLTPIVSTPDEAILSDDMKSVLNILKDDSDFLVAIISGRSLDDVKSKVELEGVYYVGNHGMEIEFLNRTYVHPGAMKLKDVIQSICAQLHPLLKDIEGVIIENKGLTASVHYRIAPPDQIPRIRQIVKAAIESYIDRGDIKLTRGKMVLEIRPNIAWDKGKAVEWFLSTIATDISQEYFPIYIGDDRTDEDAFRVISDKGISILVSSEDRETEAEFVLRNVDEVKNFLQWLSEIHWDTRT